VESFGLSAKDIQEDFDPDTYDAVMSRVFGDQYYEEEDEEKPQFSDLEDEMAGKQALLGEFCWYVLGTTSDQWYPGSSYKGDYYPGTSYEGDYWDDDFNVSLSCWREKQLSYSSTDGCRV